MADESTGSSNCAMRGGTCLQERHDAPQQAGSDAPTPLGLQEYDRRESQASGEQAAPTPDPTSIDSIYRAHMRSLYAFIYSRVGNREAAEDITSQVFVKAMAHLDLARPEGSIVAWLYRVARNTINDYWRAGKGLHMIALDDVYVVPAPPAPSDAARQEHTAARAAALLALLPDNYRTVLSLRVLEGLSVAETARRMETSEGNVKVLQHRALKDAARRADTMEQ